MNYQKTLNLPRTSFPMKADLTRREPQTLRAWEEMGLYGRQLEQNKGQSPFILHDGPPYANGHIHMGHALNKILKDIVVKSRVMAGYYSPYIPGWDCHGLPIEFQVMKELSGEQAVLNQLRIRALCREYAERYYKIQREEFKRLGVLGAWDRPYLTMDASYEASIVREFAKIVAQQRVYKRKKPVFWCPQDETALAEAEVEYEEHTSPSIYVKFPVVNAQGKFDLHASGRLCVAIWTTTPWTLAANRAICVHPNFTYRRVRTPAADLILAQDLIESCMKAFGYQPGEFSVEGRDYTGQELEGILCQHPWLNRTVPVVLGEHVTKDQGTGCVHTAPGHGQEDYEVGQRYGLEVYAPVDSQGRFVSGVEYFGGRKVFEANGEIVRQLKERSMLLKEETLTHSYPHCWRCKNPVIFRATEQWFISMEVKDLRREALSEIDRVRWVPRWGRERIYGMIENRPDWCISRQRAWGVPIVAFSCASCASVLIDAAVINHVADLMEQAGADIWFAKPARDLLPAKTQCPQCKGEAFEKERDILDVWFESGVSHAAVLRKRAELSWPADLYLEGSDQHRGWFHSALLVSLGTEGRAPYRTVLTHGFVVDGTGKKMSKSAGNVIAPQEVIDRYGAEILRLWVAAEDYREDVRISEEILLHLVEAYRKIRNTCRFLLGNLYDFDPAKQRVEDSALWEIDRWALYRLAVLTGRALKAYENFEFHTVFHALNNFCAVDMSALYLDILKDRLYTAGRDSAERRVAQRTLHEILLVLCKLMAPILTFTAEEVWKYLPDSSRTAESVHLEKFPEVASRYLEPELASRWERLLAVREEVARALEMARKDRLIGSALEAQVQLYAQGELMDFLKGYLGDLPMVFIVSAVSLSPPPKDRSGVVWCPPDVQGIEGLGIKVVRAEGQKCERCWNYRPQVGQNTSHPTLCDRCVKVLIEQGDGP